MIQTRTNWDILKKKLCHYEFNVYNALTGEILFNISKQPDMVDSYKIVKKQDSDISMKDIIFLTCIIDAIEDSIDDEE